MTRHGRLQQHVVLSLQYLPASPPIQSSDGEIDHQVERHKLHSETFLLRLTLENTL